MTCVTGFHLRDNVGIHILNIVSNHVQLVIFLPHAIIGDDDVDELIIDGKTGNIHAVSHHLLNLVYNRVWGVANPWADSYKKLVFNET